MLIVDDYNDNDDNDQDEDDDDNDDDDDYESPGMKCPDAEGPPLVWERS